LNRPKGFKAFTLLTIGQILSFVGSLMNVENLSRKEELKEALE
jgi:hypothetical protein